MTKSRVVLITITKQGVAKVRELAPRVPDAEVVVPAKFGALMEGLTNEVRTYDGALRAQMAELMADYDQLVFFVSLGAVVRLVAPYLRSKSEDPGVLVVDDAARFVIPVLSGHVGGANAYAQQLAELLGATAVITTASDVGGTIAVDILGRELGWRVEAPKINIVRVSADVVNGEPIAFVQEAGARSWWTRMTPLPGNIHCFDSFEEVDLVRHKAVLWVTHRDIEPDVWAGLAERLVVYRPPLESPVGRP